MESLLRALLSLFGWGRAFGRGPVALGRRYGRIAAHRRLRRWMG